MFLSLLHFFIFYFSFISKLPTCILHCFYNVFVFCFISFFYYIIFIFFYFHHLEFMGGAHAIGIDFLVGRGINVVDDGG